MEDYICKYCMGKKQTKTRHTISCPFNPKNNKLILAYLEKTVINNTSFVIKHYDAYARTVNIPLSKTILELFKINGFIDNNATNADAFSYLIYRSYELNLVWDLELLDIFVYKLSFGMFNLKCDDYLLRAEAISIKAGKSARKIKRARDEFCEQFGLENNS